MRDVERDALEACTQGREWRDLANAITTQANHTNSGTSRHRMKASHCHDFCVSVRELEQAFFVSYGNGQAVAPRSHWPACGRP